MEFHQISYFLAVCDYGSFTRAAQYSYVSQPSLTHAIKKLEAELGGELFTRDRSGCLLTPLGRKIEPNLRKVFKEIAATKADAIRFTRLHTLPLRIGLMTTIGGRRLNDCFARYQQNNPSTEFELIVDNDLNLLEQLDSGVLDLIISPSDLTLSATYQSIFLYKERYVVAFDKMHRFNQFEIIELKEIQTAPYLDRLNCELRECLKELCHDQEIDLYAAYRSNSEEWIVNLVRTGVGIALLPEYTIPASCGDIAWRYLVNPEISRNVKAIFPAHRQKTDEVEALLKCLTLMC